MRKIWKKLIITFCFVHIKHYFVLLHKNTFSLNIYHSSSLTPPLPPHSYLHFDNSFLLVHDYFPRIMTKFKSFLSDTFVFIVFFSTCEFIFSFIRFLISFVNLFFNVIVIVTNYHLITTPPPTFTPFFSYPTRQ